MKSRIVKVEVQKQTLASKMKQVKRKKIIFEMKADAMLMATAICEQKKGFPKE
jgi:hypothetical protein